MKTSFPVSRLLFVFAVIIIALSFSGCSKDEPPVRNEFDIMGCWEGPQGHYMAFHDNNLLYNLQIESQDGLSIGNWSRDTYLYEPGYNIVIFIDSEYKLEVYQVIELSEENLEWCWVEDIDISITSTDQIGEIIGQIIKDADHGFELNPQFIEKFSRITEDEFLNILDSLELMHPW